MATFIVLPVMVSLKLIRTDVHITLGTYPIYIPYPGGRSSWTISSKTYNIKAVTFKGDPLQRYCHGVVSFCSLKLIRRKMGKFLFALLLLFQIGSYSLILTIFSWMDLVKEYPKVFILSITFWTISSTKKSFPTSTTLQTVCCR